MSFSHRAIITIYALKDNSTQMTFSNLHDIQDLLAIEKVFIGRNALLDALQRNLFGNYFPLFIYHVCKSVCTDTESGGGYGHWPSYRDIQVKLPFTLLITG